MNIAGVRSRTCQILKHGTRPQVFKSYLIGKTEIAISGATDLQIGPSRRQNIRIDKHYTIMNNITGLMAVERLNWENSS